MFISNGWALLDSTSDRAEFLRQVRAMECNDDHGITCQNFSVDREAAHFDPAASEQPDCGSDGGTRTTAGARAEPAVGVQADESTAAIFERALLNPLFQRQAG